MGILSFRTSVFWSEGTTRSTNYLWRNSWKGIRFGKPCLQMRMPSRTPLHLNWSRTRMASILPERFSWFGMMHLTKLGFVFLKVLISLVSWSLYSWLTVLNMPFRVRAPNCVSPIVATPIPTISAAGHERSQETAYKKGVCNWPSFQIWTTKGSCDPCNKRTTFSFNGSMFFMSHWAAE